MHMRRAEAACALTWWQQHISAWRQVKNLTKSVDAYLLLDANIRAKFHPDPIWNDGALGFLKRAPQEEEQEQEEQDE